MKHLHVLILQLLTPQLNIFMKWISLLLKLQRQVSFHLCVDSHLCDVIQRHYSKLQKLTKPNYKYKINVIYVNKNRIGVFI